MIERVSKRKKEIISILQLPNNFLEFQPISSGRNRGRDRVALMLSSLQVWTKGIIVLRKMLVQGNHNYDKAELRTREVR